MMEPDEHVILKIKNIEDKGKDIIKRALAMLIPRRG